EAVPGHARDQRRGRDAEAVPGEREAAERPAPARDEGDDAQRGGERQRAPEQRRRQRRVLLVQVARHDAARKEDAREAVEPEDAEVLQRGLDVRRAGGDAQAVQRGFPQDEVDRGRGDERQPARAARRKEQERRQDRERGLLEQRGDQEADE